MNWLKTSLFLFFVFVFTNTFSQSLNDFRSTGLGADDNWTTLLNWERFDGTSWIAATYYPGNGTTNDVSIISNHTINLNTDVNIFLLNSLTIGDQSGTATSISTLLIMNDYDLDTNQISILYDGLLKWDGNHTLSLLAGTSLSLESISPYNPTTELSSDYGIFTDNGCNVNKAINIGGVLYSNCNGGGPSSPPSFDDINIGGGTLTVSPTSPSPACLGTTITLTSNPDGTDHTPGSDTFTWTAITVPVGHVFAPVTGTAENTTDTPTIAGTYTYEVEINNGTITNTNTVTIIVNICTIPKIVTNRRITYRVKK